MFCRKCGAALSDDAEFCANCGERVNPEQPKSDDGKEYQNNSAEASEKQRKAPSKKRIIALIACGVIVAAVIVFGVLLPFINSVKTKQARLDLIGTWECEYTPNKAGTILAHGFDPYFGTDKMDHSLEIWGTQKPTPVTIHIEFVNEREAVINVKYLALKNYNSYTYFTKGEEYEVEDRGDYPSEYQIKNGTKEFGDILFKDSVISKLKLTYRYENGKITLRSDGNFELYDGGLEYTRAGTATQESADKDSDAEQDNSGDLAKTANKLKALHTGNEYTVTVPEGYEIDYSEEGCVIFANKDGAKIDIRIEQNYGYSEGYLDKHAEELADKHYEKLGLNPQLNGGIERIEKGIYSGTGDFGFKGFVAHYNKSDNDLREIWVMRNGYDLCCVALFGMEDTREAFDIIDILH
ncbi:MAG: zinc-ribbon domain-containing protein [Lachnospiraceae bacterium]|nr:zinc-ribbon domain-containing protein [Lachnospiraceae bacterium]